MENTRRQEHSMESKQCDYEIPNEYGEPISKIFLFKADKKKLPTRSYVYKRKAIAEARTQAQQPAIHPAQDIAAQARCPVPGCCAEETLEHALLVCVGTALNRKQIPRNILEVINQYRGCPRKRKPRTNRNRGEQKTSFERLITRIRRKLSKDKPKRNSSAQPISSWFPIWYSPKSGDPEERTRDYDKPKLGKNCLQLFEQEVCHDAYFAYLPCRLALEEMGIEKKYIKEALYEIQLAIAHGYLQVWRTRCRHYGNLTRAALQASST
jgi:hypothetical protein